jgi:hypothetical protein
MRPIAVLSVVFMCLVAGTAGRVVAQGQTPAGARPGDPPQAAPTNLRVLPKDIARPALTALMRGYVAALGVEGTGCTYCHVDDMALRASDDNPKKAIARKMISMTMMINDDHLKGIGQAPAPGDPKVTCYTCHRGAVKPLNKAPAGGGH